MKYVGLYNNPTSSTLTLLITCTDWLRPPPLSQSRWTKQAWMIFCMRSLKVYDSALWFPGLNASPKRWFPQFQKQNSVDHHYFSVKFCVLNHSASSCLHKDAVFEEETRFLKKISIQFFFRCGLEHSIENYCYEGDTPIELWHTGIFFHIVTWNLRTFTASAGVF